MELYSYVLYSQILGAQLLCKFTITGANCRMGPFWQTTLNPMHMHVHKVDAEVAIKFTSLLLIETGVPACCLDMHASY